ncbi:MarR family transcriptional regulator [bacterium]|jgi:HTH-type transcriptional regulator, sugar sensing transcriptional regulator|nr:MarR family transcriptional regulator [bacterium]MBT4598151.1 MarR family transcriptional regulator [bacterium]MBT6754366.1 MarR family transcriptional regulator [bacterium]MBT7431276.1 MarR family transcriptional regulator [bacterium]MBT7992654.1 MarR family transcriptional regulator [bacterium]
MKRTIFEKLGLSEKETKIYLALLESGAISVRGLANITKINRGSVYDILKKLQKKGLVAFYHHETKQKFIAEDPEKLKTLIEEKERKLKTAKSDIEKIIPELRSIQEKNGQKPTTKFYEGRTGIKTILDNVFEILASEANTEKEYYVYSAKEASEDIKEAYPNFTKDRIKQGISVKAISLAGGGRVSGLDQRRWLGTEQNSATFILIYPGRCAFISRDVNGVPVGVIIENEMVYETQKVIFLQLWNLLEK